MSKDAIHLKKFRYQQQKNVEVSVSNKQKNKQKQGNMLQLIRLISKRKQHDWERRVEK